VQGLQDFAAWCRSNPAHAQCGNAGAGSMPHLLAVLLASATETPLAHVPYRGGLLALQGVASGEIAAALTSEAAPRPLADAGRVRVIATSGTARSPRFADVATFAEQGVPELTQSEWFAAFMPGRTDPALIGSAAQVLREALQQTHVRDTWQLAGLAVAWSTPAELRTELQKQSDFWGPVVRASGFKPE
jgi:tripartite-type tricarboxylate transporter receptor subunit TctC